MTVRDLVVDVERCWADARRTVEGHDLDMPVYTDPQWTVRDLLVHCAFWNDEAVAGIEAYRRGDTYATDTGADSFGAGLDAMNQRVVEAGRVLTVAEVHARWLAAQDRLTAAVRVLTGDDLDRDMTAPWGERMPVEKVVRGELSHEAGHMADIVSEGSAREKR